MTSATRPVTVPARGAWSPWIRGATSVAGVAIGSLAVGGLTSFGQQYLPEWTSSFTNSAGGWTMLAFGIVWLSRARPALGAVLGAVSFLLMVEGYGVVSAWRGYFYADPFTSVWTIIALVAGPVIGLSAAIARHGSRLRSALATVPLSAVLLGEGVWALVAIADTTSPVYWIIEIVLSAVVVAVTIGRNRLTVRQAAAVAGASLAASAVYVALWTLLDIWR
ncbi:DUF6518 family protein [Leifsonia sp. LS1]|uniref:DUF6518 family protein n=1 Tax=Leifsonia sp. LS1 TaxID=2828483 RepID=UPI001CFC6FA6|nr:DUF6518 family protein [Leifsonia sp. LS1]